MAGNRLASVSALGLMSSRQVRAGYALAGCLAANRRHGMRFSLLGALEVTDSSDHPVALGGPRLRVLLAALLLHAGNLVSADELAEMVWDTSPPPAAIPTLRSYVKRL